MQQQCCGSALVFCGSMLLVKCGHRNRRKIMAALSKMRTSKKEKKNKFFGSSRNIVVPYIIGTGTYTYGNTFVD
jgi:hypothetical protein